jgi:hypothetical protein
VSIAIYDEEKHRMVEVESREFEYQAKRFLGTLKIRNFSNLHIP